MQPNSLTLHVRPEEDNVFDQNWNLVETRKYVLKVEVCDAKDRPIRFSKHMIFKVNAFIRYRPNPLS